MRYQRKFPLSTRVTRSELYSDIYIYLYIHNFVDLYRQGLSKRKSPRLIQLISVPLLALLLRGNRSEDIPPIIPTCFVISRNQDSIEPAGSCPETAGDWPSAEHRAWALRKFSAPCSQGHGKSGRVRAAALQDSEEPRPLFASAASFRWSLNLFFKDSRLSVHSEGKPEVGRGKLGTRRRRFGGRMGGLSNFLSWVSWGGGLRRRGKGRCQLASPRGLKGVRLILSWGALEASVSSFFLLLLLFLR